MALDGQRHQHHVAIRQRLVRRHEGFVRPQDLGERADLRDAGIRPLFGVVEAFLVQIGEERETVLLLGVGHGLLQGRLGGGAFVVQRVHDGFQLRHLAFDAGLEVADRLRAELLQVELAHVEHGLVGRRVRRPGKPGEQRGRERDHGRGGHGDAEGPPPALQGRRSLGVRVRVFPVHVFSQNFTSPLTQARRRRRCGPLSERISLRCRALRSTPPARRHRSCPCSPPGGRPPPARSHRPARSAW